MGNRHWVRAPDVGALSPLSAALGFPSNAGSHVAILTPRGVSREGPQPGAELLKGHRSLVCSWPWNAVTSTSFPLPGFPGSPEGRAIA